MMKYFQLRPTFLQTVLWTALATSTSFAQSNPSPVPYETSKIEAGYNYSLALTKEGVLWSWGRNTNGALGDGTTTQRSSPVHLIFGPYSGLRFKAISASSHSAAIDTQDRLWVWGLNTWGQVGDGSTTNRNRPLEIPVNLGLAKIVSVACGEKHTVVADTDGNLWAWGDNTSGALGNGSTSNALSPVQVSTGTGMTIVVNVAAGDDHSLAASYGGAIHAWGAASYGQLGNGSTTNSSVPVLITGLKLEEDDSDSDLLPDSWEKFYFTNLTKIGTSDTDSDGLNARNEYLNNTNPNLADTDGDGIPDGLEITWGFRPLDSSDGAQDYDGDGWSNYEEIINLGTNPNIVNPTRTDGDVDGLDDLWEIAYGLNQGSSSGNNGPSGDPDNDGVLNSTEYQRGTDPMKPDNPKVKLNVTVLGD